MEGNAMNPLAKAPEDAAAETEEADDHHRLLSLVDEGRSEMRPHPEDIALRGGRTLRIRGRDESETITIRGRGGQSLLTIEVNESGAKVVLDSADLELRAVGKVDVTCDAFAVETRSFDVHAAEKATIVAADAEVRATTGDIRIHANDDIRAVGERILLNSEGTLEVPSWMRDTLDARLGPAGELPTAPLTDESGDVSLFGSSSSRRS